jgi:NTE family protein
MVVVNIMQDRITRARPAGDPPDVTITPRLARRLFDFHRAQETIDVPRATERTLDLTPRRSRHWVTPGVGDASSRANAIVSTMILRAIMRAALAV